MSEGFLQEITENLQMIGLAYDVVGIAVLGIPAVRRMSTEIAAQVGTSWNYNSELAKGLSDARVDTVFGSCLLIIGFIIQAAGVWGFQGTWICGVLLLGLLVLLIVLWVRGGRRFVSERLLERVKTRREEMEELQRAEDEARRKAAEQKG